MRNFKFLLLKLSLVCVVFCTNIATIISQPTCGTPDPIPESPSGVETSICNGNLNFLNNHNTDLVPNGGLKSISVKVNLIFLYKDDGTGNFDFNNSEQALYVNSMLTDINGLMSNIPERNCNSCTTQPVHYANPKIKFDFNIVKINNTLLWNHQNDQQPTLKVANNKNYLKSIHASAVTNSNYKSGIDVIFSVSKTNFDHYFLNNGSNPPPFNSYDGNWYADFPTSDLTVQPLIHCPDMYIDWKRNTPPLGGWTGGIRQLHFRSILHEIGHHLGLYHESCNLNIMTNANGDTRDNFNGCQMRTSLRTFMALNVRNHIECTEVIDHNIIVNNNETWSRDLKLYGDLRIKSSKSLTLTCKLEMQKNAKIIVERGAKLVIDGALITSCNDKWQGIIVEGSSSTNQTGNAGIVELKNDGIIENANIGISCNPTHIPWPHTAYYGGLIKCDGGTIRNCWKAVEIMRYGVGTLVDNSYFNGTTFENNKNGVTIWSSNGVKFDDCTFTNTQDHGIVPLDTWVRVNGCTFKGGKYCIASESTIPTLLGSEIGVTKGNTFVPSATGEGIRATSNGNITGLKIRQNNFYGGNLGVFINGASEFDIRSNDFVNQYNSVPLYASKLNGMVTNISNNNISSSNYGSGVNFANHTQYWDNCFGYNGSTDILVQFASIHPYQGIEAGNSDCIGGRAANNCFSKGSTYDIVTNNLTTTPDFVYVTKKNEAQACKIPSNPTPGTPAANYEIRCASDSNNGTCGSPGSGGVVNVQYPTCNIPKTDAEYNQMVTWLTAQIAWIEALTYPNAYQKYLLTTYKDCLKKIKKQKVVIEKQNDETNGTTGWRSRSIAHLNALPDFQSRMYAYGLMVEDGQYSNARSWLNNMSRSTEEENDFYTIQNINLDYLENVGNYTLTNTDRNILYNLGSKTIPLNGFARSLYYQLTGDRIPITMDYGGSNTQGRSKSDEVIDWKVRSFPNPVSSGIYNIEIVDGNVSDQFNIEILDLRGKVLFNKSNVTNLITQVDVSSWLSGLYICKIQNNSNKRLVIEKMIKL